MRDDLIGRRVRSVPIGNKPAFEGVVVARQGKGLLVEDDGGLRWNRFRSELTVIPDGKANRRSAERAVG